MGINEVRGQRDRILDTLQRLFSLYEYVNENVEDYRGGFDFRKEVFKKFNFGYDEDTELNDSLELLLAKVERVFTSSLSHVHGLSKEVDSALKQLSKEGRYLVPDVGDIGVATSYGGKAIQHKFTSTARYEDVDKHVKKALQQLTGAMGELPHPDNNRIADISIDRQDNCWPYTQAQQSVPSLTSFLSTVETRVLHQFTSMLTKLPGNISGGFLAWINATPLPAATDVMSIQEWENATSEDEERRFPNASWVVGKVSTGVGFNTEYRRLHQLLVKLRFSHAVQVDVRTNIFSPVAIRALSQVNVAIYSVQSLGPPTYVARTTKKVFV